MSQDRIKLEMFFMLGLDLEPGDKLIKHFPGGEPEVVTVASTVRWNGDVRGVPLKILFPTNTGMTWTTYTYNIGYTYHRL